jgi:hypothetical protein
MSFSFPQFRKNTTGTNYYQITSFEHVAEWQQLGSKWLRLEVHAKILPERLLIQDLLECSNGHYDTITEQEFQEAVEG